jgi:hypothetical protein
MTTTKTKKETLRYIGEETRWFMDFLPKTIFNSLDREKRKYYREYRRRQRNIGESNLKIDKILSEIDELNKLIKKEKEKQKSWYDKLKMYYDPISYLDRDFRFSCSIEYRKRTSRKKGDKPYVYLYSHLNTTSNRVSIYLGNEINVKRQISELFGEDTSEDDRETLVEEYLRPILTSYGRYHIHKLGWKGIGKKSLNLELVCKWVNKVGFDEVREWIH